MSKLSQTFNSKGLQLSDPVEQFCFLKISTLSPYTEFEILPSQSTDNFQPEMAIFDWSNLLKASYVV